MTTIRMTRILLDVVNGAPPPRGESDEDAAMREQLTREVDAIRAQGGIVDVAPEIP